MSDTRHKNTNWQIFPNFTGKFSHEGAMLVVLMDLRDELQSLVRIFSCPNFIEIPTILQKIEKNTMKKMDKKKRKKI